MQGLLVLYSSASGVNCFLHVVSTQDEGTTSQAYSLLISSGPAESPNVQGPGSDLGISPAMADFIAQTVQAAVAAECARTQVPLVAFSPSISPAIPRATSRILASTVGSASANVYSWGVPSSLFSSANTFLATGGGLPHQGRPVPSNSVFAVFCEHVCDLITIRFQHRECAQSAVRCDSRCLSLPCRFSFTRVGAIICRRSRFLAYSSDNRRSNRRWQIRRHE